jgi:hypothetical protein
MNRFRAIALVCGGILLVLVEVCHAQGGVPPVMLPIPPYPRAGDIAHIYVIDQSLATPNADPFIYVYNAESPERVVRYGARWSGSSVDLSLEALPVGKYTAKYFDVPTALGPNDRPKLSIEFFIYRDGPVNVVEYYSATRDHYFMTTDFEEMARLDTGVTPGWQRTGESFHALPPEKIPSYGRPVCRFYGLPEFGIDSHFFAATPQECQAVEDKWPDRWLLETRTAFGTYVDIFPIDCSDTMQHVYRLYNNRPDANHRYTVSAAIRDAMIAKGWILEAFDHFPWEEPYTMCVPL